MIKANAQTIEKIEPATPSVGGEGRYGVIIYNNDTSTEHEVILLLMRATHCSADEAYAEMWEAHTFGRAWVHFSSEDECQRVADIINKGGVDASVQKEWD